MVYNNVILTVTEAGNVATVQGLLTDLAVLSKEEPGCARFEVYHSQSDTTVFMLIERWESQAHLDAHRQAAGFKEIYEPKVLPLLERVPHPSDLVI